MTSSILNRTGIFLFLGSRPLQVSCNYSQHAAISKANDHTDHSSCSLTLSQASHPQNPVIILCTTNASESKFVTSWHMHHKPIWHKYTRHNRAKYYCTFAVAVKHLSYCYFYIVLLTPLTYINQIVEGINSNFNPTYYILRKYQPKPTWRRRLNYQLTCWKVAKFFRKPMNISY